MRVIALFENEHYYSLLRGNFNYAVAQIFQKLVNRSVTNFLRLSSTYRVKNRYRHDPEAPVV